MKKIVVALCVLFLGLTLIIFPVLADNSTNTDNIIITITSNNDVDQIVVNSGMGEFLLTPKTEYSNEELKGNNQVMDMNGDLQVNSDDYDILKAHIDGGCKDYTAKERCPHCGAADINDDGMIDNNDLKMLQRHLDEKCKLDDCYFHGTRMNREEDPDNEDQYIWSFNYTPTIRGTDNMTFKPQSVTTTGIRTGDEKELTIKAEEFKNPEIIRAGVFPNQDKYLINTSVKIYAVTPLETDRVIFETQSEKFVVDIPESIDYVKAEKTWSKTYNPDTAEDEDITITGQGEQSSGTYKESDEPVTFSEKIVNPQIIDTDKSTVKHVQRWTTHSTDADGNVSITEHVDTWYTITVKATANADTDYVVFDTPHGDVTDKTYTTSDSNRLFSTSWTSESSGETASAEAFCTIITR
jgi:hypothetical protein